MSKHSIYFALQELAKITDSVQYSLFIKICKTSVRIQIIICLTEVLQILIFKN